MNYLLIMTRWGLLSIKNQMLNFYCDFDFIQKAINTEQYIVSIWLFKNLPHMFKNSYVLFLSNGINDKKDIVKLIKKFEKVEGVIVSDEKKDEILDKSENVLDKTKPIFIKTHITSQDYK